MLTSCAWVHRLKVIIWNTEKKAQDRHSKRMKWRRRMLSNVDGEMLERPVRLMNAVTWSSQPDSSESLVVDSHVLLLLPGALTLLAKYDGKPPVIDRHRMSLSILPVSSVLFEDPLMTGY